MSLGTKRSSASKAGYLERYIGGIDRIETGRYGSISSDRWLVVNYKPEYASILERFLSYENERVRAETVMLFTNVREYSVADTVRGMSTKDTEKVRGACIGYMSVVTDATDRIPKLLETIRYKSGEEFSKAAVEMGDIGRMEDIDLIRRSYGLVKGSMRKELHDTLTRIIDRHPELEHRRDLILSLPVRPDEDDFGKFLDKSIEYLDKRYRENIHPEKIISAKVRNNISSALNTMNVRLYNEADNLKHYCAVETERADILSDLVTWATKDLSEKNIRTYDKSHRCPGCGREMTYYNGSWSCLDC